MDPLNLKRSPAKEAKSTETADTTTYDVVMLSFKQLAFAVMPFPACGLREFVAFRLQLAFLCAPCVSFSGACSKFRKL